MRMSSSDIPSHSAGVRALAPPGEDAEDEVAFCRLRHEVEYVVGGAFSGGIGHGVCGFAKPDAAQRHGVTVFDDDESTIEPVP